MTPVLPSGLLPGEVDDNVPGPLGQKALPRQAPLEGERVSRLLEGETVIPRFGPRGGDLTRPSLNIVAQMADLNDGDTGAHRKDGYRPTAVQGLANEQPWQTMAAYMFAMRRTISEVAAAAGVTYETVRILRAQKWFQQKCATVANNAGDEITAAFHAHALESVERIAEIAANGESERVRLAANQIIVEQAVGRPVQKTLNINAEANSGLSPQEEYARVAEELRALRESQQRPQAPAAP